MLDSIDEDVLTEALTDLAGMFALRTEVGEVVWHLTDHLVDLLALAGAGVAMADTAGRMHPLTGVNELSTSLEAEEARLQEGPCVDAFRRGEVVSVEDLAASAEPWPAWGPEAQRRGVRAVLSVPLRVKVTSLGAISLYSLEPRRWHQDELLVARMLSDLTSSYVAHRWEVQRTRETATQLQEALESRIVIEQAKGVLASDLDCTVDDAFVLLRQQARSTSSTLRSVAHAVVHNGFRPGHESVVPDRG